MDWRLLSAALLAACCACVGTAGDQAARTTVDPINFDWRFAKGDHASAKDPVFDDSSWSLLDAKGNLYPLAMNNLRLETEGAALFMGVANGDQMGLDTLTDETHPLFHGQAVAALRSKPGASGPAVLTVTDDNGIRASIRVNFESGRP